MVSFLIKLFILCICLMMRSRCSTRESEKESGSSIGREGASARPVRNPESGPSENCVSVDPAALISRADKFAGDAQQEDVSAAHRDKFTLFSNLDVFFDDVRTLITVVPVHYLIS